MGVKRRPARESRTIDDVFVREVQRRLEADKPVRRTLPDGGRLHIDRPLPFLAVYRRPPRDPDQGTDRLVTTEASYLVFSGSAGRAEELTRLLRGVVPALAKRNGACLVLGLWSGEATATPELSRGDATPAFRLFAPAREDLGGFLDHVGSLLSRIRIRGQRARVETTRHRWPRRGRLPALELDDAATVDLLGLEVGPIFRDAATGEVYPLLLRELRRALSGALRRAFFEYARTQTLHGATHYHMLGRRAVVKAVWQVDQGLARIADSFDVLLQVTPVNVTEAWRDFERGRFGRAPVFHYRPSPVDPLLLKRKLYEVPLERVEDPALSLIFRQKLDELDRQITLLQDINTPRFVHGSLQLFGDVDADLVSLATELLDALPPRSREDSRNGRLDAAAFADVARAEVAFYRHQWPDVSIDVQIRDDVGSGLMVSRGTLLIGTRSSIPKARAEALLQHEVGTHLLTYFNGRAQPFRQLYSGLAGYEAMQEGLAVLAEYLVGGLSRPRLRLLAARVIATQHMVRGGSFVDTFNLLNAEYGFSRPTAFTVAMRIFRGAGLTKDVVYLRGLRDVLAYLRSGGDLQPLFMGKIAVEHVPVINELRWRGVLRASPLTPRYLEREDVRVRLAAVRKGLGVLDLVRRSHQ